MTPPLPEPRRRVAVVQPLPGLGDMIWHLPHIRSIAAHVGHPVTLVTKPRSRADKIFAAETAVKDVFWLDRNPERRRGQHDGAGGWLRAIASLRAQQFDAIYVLHHSKTIALLTMLAGIPERYGYGYGVQGWFLNRPPKLPNAVLPLHPYQQATEYLRAAGIPMVDPEPRMAVSETDLQTARSRISGHPVAIGIGSSEAYKQWGAARYAALADGLAQQQGVSGMVLVGGPGEAGLAAEILATVRHARITSALDWSVPEIGALLSLSAYYVGNDTGFMNMAAAVGARTYGLFGAVKPFGHASCIVAIVPPGGISKSDGMARISVEQVLTTIAADQARAGTAGQLAAG